MVVAIFFIQHIHQLHVAVFFNQFANLYTLNSFENTSLKNDVFFVVDNRIQLFRWHTKEVTNLVRSRTEVPNVSYRHNELDVTRTFTTHFLFSYFYTTTVADNTFITDTFVFTAMTFVVTTRTENALAEQTIAFRFVCTIVDSFRFQNLTV